MNTQDHRSNAHALKHNENAEKPLFIIDNEKYAGSLHQLFEEAKGSDSLPSDLQERADFLESFYEESDRGAVLMAVSLLDETLLEILKAFFISTSTLHDLLESPTAPLMSFYARLMVAYSLGLIQENEFREINTIRKIRNEFAHKWRDVDFATPKIHNLCMQLPWLGPAEYEVDHGNDGKIRFRAAIAILIYDLVWRSVLVKEEKRTPRRWPNKVWDR